MPPMDSSATALTSPMPRWQRNGPIVALLLLAPFISEVLYGATRVSVIFALVPEVMTWGCGALVRECVRRWHKGWPSMLLLGLALAVAEECVIQQTSIAPLAGLAQHAYGRVWGVNWVYFLWALGYESVWVVLIPVQLTELLFPVRREDSWLRTRGLVIVGIVFVLGSGIAWYGWTQQARVMVFHLPPYSPPPLYIATAVGVILLLMIGAKLLPSVRLQENHTSHSAPAAWLVRTVLCALGTPWGALVLLGFGSFPAVPFGFVLIGELAWAALTLLLVRRWTRGPVWGDAHRFALVFGGVVACMIGGLLSSK